MWKEIKADFSSCEKNSVDPLGVFDKQPNYYNLKVDIWFYYFDILILKCNFDVKLEIWAMASQWRCSGVSGVNFEHISHLALVLLLLTFNM